ncbi:MAG: hypothetical protein P1U56_19230 [Saprospiraceae bacterium]|nr:hypothetical protein [Saprospiraceae bacterium]
MRNIHIISINHRTHSSDERIQLDLTDESGNQLRGYLRLELGVLGCVHLRTCNRIELIYEAERNLNKKIVEKWLDLSFCSTKIDSGSFECFAGADECIEHLHQLSVGFKSAIYGDDQILSQLKKAFENARKQKELSTLLERSYQSIMRFHKKVCRETDFKSHTISLAYQALKSAKRKFGVRKLAEKKLLIIGAGDMAAQVVKYSSKFKFGNICITNRTESKARNLVKNTTIEVLPIQEVNFQQFDLVISCTDQGFDQIDDWSSIEYYIDLSLYSSQIKSLEVGHIFLQELQEVINGQNKARMQAVDKVQLILLEKSNEYTEWCAEWKKRAMTAQG